MKTKVILILAMLSIVCSAAVGQEQFVSEIKVQTYEKWWGLKASDDFSQPFEDPFEINTADIDADARIANVMLSSKGRYIYSNYPMKVSFDGQKIKVVSEKEKVDVVKGGGSLREAYLVCRHKFFRPTPSSISPELFYKPVYELGNKSIHTQQDVLQFARKIQNRDLPSGYIIIPDGWRNQQPEMDFLYEDYPDPKQMISSLHEMGFKVILTVDAYIPANGPLYLKYLQNDLFITDKEGKPVIVERPRGYYACLNMTDDFALSLNEDLKRIQDVYGLDGFYIDFSEVCKLYYDSDEKLAEYAGMWNKACEGVNNVIITYNAALNGDFVYVLGTYGDSDNTNMELSVSTALKNSVFGVSAFAYAPELNGDDPLTVRAVQLSMMMPVAIVPSVAWNLTNGSVLKNMLNWRDSISDYMNNTVGTVAVTAEPLIRSMEYQFGGSTFYTCDDEFMLGADYLIAPVFEESQFRMVRLPRGTWLSPSGEKYRGPRIVNTDVGNGGFAVFRAQ